MPIYEYRCKKCGDFEVTQRITDKPLAKCPTCKNKVSKLISATSFQLKGSGWYITDYGRGEGKGKSSASESKSDDSSAKGSESKASDSKSSESKSTKSSESKSSDKTTKASSTAAAA